MTDWHKTEFRGVRYRKHATRRHGVKYDRYFVITYKLNGKTKSEAIGWASHKVTAKECDDILRQLKENHRKCQGPQTHKEMKTLLQAALIEEMSVGSVEELFQSYVDHLNEAGRASWHEVERALLSSIKTTPAADQLGRDRAAKSISSKEVQQVLEEVHKRAPSMAAHLRSYLHGAFAYGISREFDYARPDQDIRFDITKNPVGVIPRNANAFKARDRFLAFDEVKQLLENIDKYCVARTACFFHLIFAVGGQRVKEVLEAPFDEFNFKEKLWTIPGERTKNGKDHLVPLTARAIRVVKSIQSMNTDKSCFLFPKRWRPNETMPCTSINDIVKKFCHKEEIELWRPSDIRRTCRTHLSESGVEPHLLNWHFNHGDQGVGERHYDKSHHLDEKRVVMKRWDELLKKCLEKKEI